MSGSLGSELSFCFFSFLFGMVLIWSREVLRGFLSALRLLPPLVKGGWGKGCFWGYLLFDLLFFVLGSASYMIFLYASHSGIFRVYSLLLLLGGGYLWRRPAHHLGARPVFFCLDRILLPFRLLFRKCLRKKAKQLDESKEMV